VAKKFIAAGKDPSTQKKLDKLELKTSHANNFEAIAREWHESRKHTWSDKRPKKNAERASSL
jgi:hypothetical protein